MLASFLGRVDSLLPTKRVTASFSHLACVLHVSVAHPLDVFLRRASHKLVSNSLNHYCLSFFPSLFSLSLLPPPPPPLPNQERQKLAPLLNISGGGDGTATRSHSLSSPTTSTFSVGTLGVPSPTPSPSNLSTLAGSNDTSPATAGNSTAMELGVLDAGSVNNAFGRSPGGGGTTAAVAAAAPSCSTSAGGEGSVASDAGGASNISDRCVTRLARVIRCTPVYRCDDVMPAGICCGFDAAETRTVVVSISAVPVE